MRQSKLSISLTLYGTVVDLLYTEALKLNDYLELLKDSCRSIDQSMYLQYEMNRKASGSH